MKPPTDHPPNATYAIAYLHAHGWLRESIQQAPLFALSDWFREHGSDDYADYLLEESDPLRAWVWLDSPVSFRAALIYGGYKNYRGQNLPWKSLEKS